MVESVQCIVSLKRKIKMNTSRKRREGGKAVRKGSKKCVVTSTVQYLIKYWREHKAYNKKPAVTTTNSGEEKKIKKIRSNN